MSSSPRSKKVKTDETQNIGGQGKSSSRLVGFDNFKRHNPMSDRFLMKDFDHLDIWCGDATNTAGRFATALGMTQRAKSDLTTGNFHYTSHVIQSNDIVMVFTAPYFTQSPPPQKPSINFLSFPDINRNEMLSFIAKHGFAVRAIGIKVEDATKAYEECMRNGARSMQRPTLLQDTNGKVVYSEISFYEDVVFRFVERHEFRGDYFMPGYAKVDGGLRNYGLKRVDHIVSNVPEILPLTDYATKVTGLHEYAEFVAADIGTVDSGLNSLVLANNTETVLMPINEPTFGTRRKSQIQSFLEHHQGPGVQHVAVATDDIFKTMEMMQSLGPLLGFDFMGAPGGDYYEKHVPEKMKGMLDAETIQKCKKYNILIDRDDEGGLLQIFTKPVLDRPTLFFEIIQRIGCPLPGGLQKPACGGFGKGNFGALFKSIEDWEKKIDGVEDNPMEGPKC